MIKIIKIIFVNVIIITLIIIISSVLINKNFESISNYFVNKSVYNKTYSSKIKLDKNTVEEFTAKRIELNKNTTNNYCGEYRFFYGTNYIKKPIVILGCSYAYGHGLENDKTFSYKLSQITQRPVYNFAICGGQVLQGLNYLKSFVNATEYNKQIIKDAEYVIYVYMHDHIDRYLSFDLIYLNYKKLFPIKNNFFKKLIDISLFRLICSLYQIDKISMGGGKNTDCYYKFLQRSEQYLKNIMLNTNLEIKKYSPNAKFIVILYDQKIALLYDNFKIKYNSDIQNSKIWEELNNETDMTIIHSKDITGFLFDKNYKLDEDISDWHPNEKAWDVFTPEFAKKYIN